MASTPDILMQLSSLYPLSWVAFIAVQVGLFAVGRVVAAAVEWWVHKVLFHELGRRKGSMFAFHLREHHRACRKEEMVDEAYVYGSLTDRTNGRAREVWTLTATCLLLLPVLPVAPGLVAGLWFGAWRYHYCHRKSHLDPEWGRTHLRWHYDHHMGPNPEANWGVSNDWFDRWMGTRHEWHGTWRPRRRRHTAVEVPAHLEHEAAK